MDLTFNKLPLLILRSPNRIRSSQVLVPLNQAAMSLSQIPFPRIYPKRRFQCPLCGSWAKPDRQLRKRSYPVIPSIGPVHPRCCRQWMRTSKAIPIEPLVSQVLDAPTEAETDSDRFASALELCDIALRENTPELLAQAQLLCQSIDDPMRRDAVELVMRAAWRQLDGQ